MEEQVAEIARTCSVVQQIAAPAVDPTPRCQREVLFRYSCVTNAFNGRQVRTRAEDGEGTAARNAEAYAAEIGYSVRFDQNRFAMGNTVLINLEGGRR